MSQITIIIYPNDKKAKKNQFYPKKIIISTIRGDQFLYIFLLDLITSLVPVVTVFFLNSLIPLLWGFFLYYIPLSSSFPLFTCRSSCWLQFLTHKHILKVFRSRCKVACYCLCITSILMRLEDQLQCIQCGDNIFFLNISQLPFVLCFYDVYPYQ